MKLQIPIRNFHIQRTEQVTKLVAEISDLGHFNPKRDVLMVVGDKSVVEFIFDHSEADDEGDIQVWYMKPRFDTKLDNPVMVVLLND